MGKIIISNRFWLNKYRRLQRISKLSSFLLFSLCISINAGENNDSVADEVLFAEFNVTNDVNSDESYIIDNLLLTKNNSFLVSNIDV